MTDDRRELEKWRFDVVDYDVGYEQIKHTFLVLILFSIAYFQLSALTALDVPRFDPTIVYWFMLASMAYLILPVSYWSINVILARLTTWWRARREAVA